jgi:hypothetical protein
LTFGKRLEIVASILAAEIEEAPIVAASEET